MTLRVRGERALQRLSISNSLSGSDRELNKASNPTPVAVDSTGAIYVGEVNGTNVKKFIKTKS